MPASLLKIALKNLVRRNIGTPGIIFVLQLKKICKYINICTGESDPEHDEQELIIEDLSEMINL